MKRTGTVPEKRPRTPGQRLLLPQNPELLHQQGGRDLRRSTQQTRYISAWQVSLKQGSLARRTRGGMRSHTPTWSCCT